MADRASAEGLDRRADEDYRAAVAEIERWAGDPRFVQVLMVTRTAEPPGQKQYWKIYEAAAAAGLPIGVHAFGFGGYSGHAARLAVVLHRGHGRPRPVGAVASPAW